MDKSALLNFDEHIYVVAGLSVVFYTRLWEQQGRIKAIGRRCWSARLLVGKEVGGHKTNLGKSTKSTSLNLFCAPQPQS